MDERLRLRLTTCYLLLLPRTLLRPPLVELNLVLRSV